MPLSFYAARRAIQLQKSYLVDWLHPSCCKPPAPLPTLLASHLHQNILADSTMKWACLWPRRNNGKQMDTAYSRPACSAEGTGPARRDKEITQSSAAMAESQKPSQAALRSPRAAAVYLTHIAVPHTCFLELQHRKGRKSITTRLWKEDRPTLPPTCTNRPR